MPLMRGNELCGRAAGMEYYVRWSSPFPSPSIAPSFLAWVCRSSEAALLPMKRFLGCFAAVDEGSGGVECIGRAVSALLGEFILDWWGDSAYVCARVESHKAGWLLGYARERGHLSLFLRQYLLPPFPAMYSTVHAASPT